MSIALTGQWSVSIQLPSNGQADQAVIAWLGEAVPFRLFCCAVGAHSLPCMNQKLMTFQRGCGFSLLGNMHLWIAVYLSMSTEINSS